MIQVIMKKILIFVLLFVFMTNFSVYNAHAQDFTATSFEVLVDAEAKTITVEGQSQRNVGYATVYLLNEGKNIGDIAADESLGSVVLHMGQTRLNNDGSYIYTLGYGEAQGVCSVFVGDGDTVQSKTVSIDRHDVVGNIYNLPLVLNENRATTTWENFENSRSGLPDEMPVYTPVEVKGSSYIYVSSKDGNDSNDGTIDRPYKTVTKAIVKAKANPAGAVIYLRGGVYSASDGINISSIEADPTAPMIISSYSGETVKFKDITTISGSEFGPVSDATGLDKINDAVIDNVIAVNLKQKGITDYGAVTNRLLCVNDVDYTLARWPNNTVEYMKKYTGADNENGVIDSGPITRDGSDCGPKRGTGLYGGTGFEFMAEKIRPFIWENTGNIYMYGSFYAEWRKNDVQILSFDSDRQSIRTASSIEYGAKYSKDNCFYYYNVLEELDAPGEWFLDDETGMLYIYPLKNLNNFEVSLSCSPTKICNISNSKNIVVNGINFEQSGETAATLKSCENVMFQNCSFENVYSGLIIQNESKFCGVVTSIFKDVEHYPVYIAQPSVTSTIMKELIPQYNFVQNNYVYNCGIISVNGNSNIVSHNVVSNSTSHSIYSDRGHECVIEYNEIYSGLYTRNDGGAIYVGGHRLGSGGNHIRYNYIHDMVSPTGPAVYFDDLTSRSYIYGNVIDGSKIFLHNGSNNVVFNNIVLNANYASGYTDSDNYMNTDDGFYSLRWEQGALQYGAYTEFLDTTKTNVYIDVLNGAYAERYPLLKDWAEKMYQRIAEYEQTGSAHTSSIKTHYSDGTEVDLDTYLRSPRDNAYVNNLFINCGATALRLKAANRTVPYMEENNCFMNSNPFESGDYSDSDAYNAVKNNIANFETIPFEKIGIITADSDSAYNENSWAECVALEKPDMFLPVNNSSVSNEGLIFKWEGILGAGKYNIIVSENQDLSSPVIDEYTYNNSFADAAGIIKADKTYYWKITCIPMSNKVSGYSNSDVSVFRTENSQPYVGCGIAGIEIEKADESTIIKARVFNVQEQSANNMSVFAGIYDQNGNLLNVMQYDVPELPSNSLTDDITFDFAAVDNSGYFKIYLWNKSAIMPLVKMKTDGL